MSIPTPSARPNADWQKLSARLTAAGHDVTELNRLPLYVCAVRGLFSLSIGAPGNDINAYDDALYVVIPQASGDPRVVTFNANTDPTRYGWNASAGKYMARLKAGRYKMRYRLHGGRYWAFGQDGSPVTVERIRQDGSVAETETGSFGIDLHPGGLNTTSSEGCQTVPREQWTELRRLLVDTIGREWFPYVLMEEEAPQPKPKKPKASDG